VKGKARKKSLPLEEDNLSNVSHGPESNLFHNNENIGSIGVPNIPLPKHGTVFHHSTGSTPPADMWDRQDHSHNRMVQALNIQLEEKANPAQTREEMPLLDRVPLAPKELPEKTQLLPVCRQAQMDKFL
jgi:hypothetical protein